MNEAKLNEIFYLLIKFAAVVVIVINTGVALVLVRQVFTMSSIIKTQDKSWTMFLLAGFLVAVIFSLLYAILI